MRRVVITGMGVVSPIGHSVTEFWGNLSNGVSGIGPITNISSQGLSNPIAAEVKNFDTEKLFDAKKLPMLDRFSQLGIVAAREAVTDSGLAFEGEMAERTATIIGTGVGGQNTLEEAYNRLLTNDRKIVRVHPFTVPRLMVNAATSHISMEHGITGPSYSIASACASATHAIGTAVHLIRSGLVDRAVTGGAESCLTFGTLKGWEALRVVAGDTCRPFSLGRGGMVLGEGAAVFILETLEDAQKRGAKIYALGRTRDNHSRCQWWCSRHDRRHE